jgi:glycosyltransferase involved in cell wall biosynthesis
MRVALVHDWLVVSGGAEKVTREVQELFNADVFALVDFLNDEDRAFILHGERARTSFIQRLPLARTRFRSYLPLFPLAMERLDLRGYDLIISASYAVAKCVRKSPGQRHLCYIHTPMRYAWVNEEGYLRDHGLSGAKAWMVRKVLGYLRRKDLASNAGVDRFIANSSNVADRVARIYGRQADVVLPPVDMERFALYEGPRDGYLVVSRLVPYKRVDRIVEAFRSLPDRKLTVVGDGPERSRLKAMAPANVHFTGHVPMNEVVRYLQHARAVICAADEDLGLVPMEAQACGTPCVALGSGGHLETVEEGRSGVFFPSDRAEDIVAAVVRSEGMFSMFTPERLRLAVEPCSSFAFRAVLRRIVAEMMRGDA